MTDTQLDLAGAPTSHQSLNKRRVAIIKLETIATFAQRFADSQKSERLKKEIHYARKYVTEVLKWD